MITVAKLIPPQTRFVAAGAGLIGLVTLALLERHHPNNAFSYRDGVDTIGLLNYIHKLGFSFYIPFVNFQTLGGFYGMNHWISPSMWVAAAFGTSQPMLDASYVLCAVELYFSTCLLSRALGALPTTAAIGALLLPLFILPLVWQDDPFNTLLTFSTIFSDIIVLNNVILIGLTKTITQDGYNRWGYFLVALGASWIILLTPLATVLVIPFDIVFYGVLSVNLFGTKKFWPRQLPVFAVVLALLTVFGPYLFGLFENTSSGLFATELTGDVFSNPWGLLPIPFKNFKNAFWTAAILIALAGQTTYRPAMAADTAFSKRMLWILSVFCLLALSGSAAFILLAHGSGTFPRPAYFEIVAWPFYFIAIGVIADFAWRYVCASLPFAWIRNDYAVFAAFTLLAMFLGALALQRYVDRIMPYRPQRDSIVQFLQTGLTTKDSSYTGQVATFAGTANNVGDTLAYDRSVELSAGNAHRGETLRYFGLSTLDEYNSLITPEKYLLLTRFFGHPTDDQSRAMTVYTRIDQKALAAFGVRYVVTDHALPSPAMLRSQEAVPGIGMHFVYELQDVNRGTYTPVSQRLVAALENQLRAMLDPAFDFRSQLVTATPLPVLTPAQSRLWVVPGRYHIEASSAGTSLVLLPIGYSRCMRWENGPKALPPPRLLRVDFALTGILFSHAVSGTIHPIESPFADPFCGISDWRDAHGLADHRRTLWPGGLTAPH